MTSSCACALERGFHFNPRLELLRTCILFAAQPQSTRQNDKRQPSRATAAVHCREHPAVRRTMGFLKPVRWLGRLLKSHRGKSGPATSSTVQTTSTAALLPASHPGVRRLLSHASLRDASNGMLGPIRVECSYREEVHRPDQMIQW